METENPLTLTVTAAEIAKDAGTIAGIVDKFKAMTKRLEDLADNIKDIEDQFMKHDVIKLSYYSHGRGRWVDIESREIQFREDIKALLLRRHMDTLFTDKKALDKIVSNGVDAITAFLDGKREVSIAVEPVEPPDSPF